MRTLSRLWLAVAAASNLIPASMASKAAGSEEGYRGPHTQEFAAKRGPREEMAKTIRTEEPGALARGVGLLSQPTPLHTAMLGMFKAAEEREAETYGSPTSVPAPPPPPPPALPSATRDEDESSSTSALWFTAMPAPPEYTPPSPISWVNPSDEYNPADSDASTASPTGGDTPSTQWPTTRAGVRQTTAPSPTSTAKRSPSPTTASSQGLYPAAPTTPPASLEVPVPGIPAENPTRSPFSSPAPLKTNAPSHDEKDVGNSGGASLPPAPSSQAPESPAKEDGEERSASSPVAWTTAPGTAMNGRGGGIASPSPIAPGAYGGKEQAPLPSTPTNPPVSVGVPIPSPLFDNGPEQGRDGTTMPTYSLAPSTAATSAGPTPTPTGFLVSFPTSSSSATRQRDGPDLATFAPTFAPSAAPTGTPAQVGVSSSTTAYPSQAAPTSSPTAAPTASRRGGSFSSAAASSSLSSSSSSPPPTLDRVRGSGTTASPTASPTTHFMPRGPVGIWNTATPTTSPSVEEPRFGPTATPTDGELQGQVPSSAYSYYSAAPSAVPSIENSPSPATFSTSSPTRSSGRDAGPFSSSSPTAAPSTSLTGRGGGDLGQWPEVATAAPTVAGRTASPVAGTQVPTAVDRRTGYGGSASPTAGFTDRGFDGDTLAPTPALPWLEPTSGPTSSFASASSSTAAPTSSTPPTEESEPPLGNASFAPSPAPAGDIYPPRRPASSAPSTSPASSGYPPVPQPSLTPTASPTDGTSTSRGRSSSAASASPTDASSTAVPRLSPAPTASPLNETSAPRGQPTSSASPAPTHDSEPSGGQVSPAPTSPSPGDTSATRERSSSAPSPAPTESRDASQEQASPAPSALQLFTPTPSPGPGSRGFAGLTPAPTGPGTVTMPRSPLFFASVSPSTTDDGDFSGSDSQTFAPTASPTLGDRDFAGTTASPTGDAAASVPPSASSFASASPTTEDRGHGEADPRSSAPTVSPTPGDRDFAGTTPSPTGFAAVTPSPFSSESASPTTTERGFGGADARSSAPTASPSPGDRGFAGTTPSPTAFAAATTVPPSASSFASASPTTTDQGFREADARSSAPTASPTPGDRGFAGTTPSPTGFAAATTVPPSPFSSESASPTTTDRGSGGTDPRSPAPTASSSSGDRDFAGATASPTGAAAATVPPSASSFASASPTTTDRGFGEADPRSSAPTASTTPGDPEFVGNTPSPTGFAAVTPSASSFSSASPTTADRGHGEADPRSSAPTVSPSPGDRDFAGTTPSPTGFATATTVPPSPLSTSSASPITTDQGFGEAEPRSSAPTASPTPSDRGFAGTTSSPTGFAAATAVPPSPFSSESASPTTDPGLGGTDPRSPAPTASPSSGGRDFAGTTASPTGAAAATVPPSASFASASPTTADRGFGGADPRSSAPTASPTPSDRGFAEITFAPTGATDPTVPPSPFLSASASPTTASDRGSAGADPRSSAPTASPSSGDRGFAGITPSPTGGSVGTTVSPSPADAGAPGSSASPTSGGSGVGDVDATDDGALASGAPTATPHAPSTAPTSLSAAPTFGIGGDGGIDRELPPTPAPTDHAEDLWDWWHQEGTPRADRGQALAAGAGEYADLRFLVGTEDGVVQVDPAASSDSAAGLERRTRRRLQSDMGSGQDVSVVCLSIAGEDLWHKNMGSAGEDVALCAEANGNHLVIAGYTTENLYSDNNGEDDAFLAILDPANGGFLGGWQFGGGGSERVYALALDAESGDIIVGGFTTGSLFSTNDNEISQYFVARLKKHELLLYPTGRLDLSHESSGDVVVWGWQYSTPATLPEAIVSVKVSSTRGVVTALGSRGLPPAWSPRDPDFFPEDEGDLSSMVLFIDLENGELVMNSIRLLQSLGTSMAVDDETGDAYVAGFIASSSDDESGDEIVVHKILSDTGAKGWSYAATSEGVSVGRALAVNLFGEPGTNVMVAGTTSGARAHPSAGETDIFSLLLSTEDGSQACYYQVGTDSRDVVTGLSVENSGTSLFPDVSIGGFTGGSLAAPTAGETDVFALGLNVDLICPDLGKSTSAAEQAEARGSFAAGAVSILAGFAIVGAVVSTVIAPTAGVASTAAAAAAGGAGAAGTASACPASGGGAGALVTILSAGHGAGGLTGHQQSAPPPGEATYRSPSASIGLLVMMQLQFLALLSLVPSIHDSTSFLAAFVDKLRWVNLWLPLPSSIIPESCDVADPDTLMDNGVFFGNTALVLGILLAIFLVHVAVISAVEAYWLAQDHAKAAVKAAHHAYGMSAADLAVQASSRSRSRRGRGRFSAVANAADGGNAQGLSPGSPGGDMISFEDLEDSDPQRLRSVFPAPTSSVGSPRSLSPPSGPVRRSDGPPTSPSSCYADDLPSALAGSPPPAAGDAAAAGHASPASPPSTMSVWIDSPSEQHQHRVITAGMRSVSASPARRHESGGSRHGSAFSRRDDETNAVDSYARGTVMSSECGPGFPPMGHRRPNSIMRRISDKGGGSLPGSPTRDGGRYGGTDQLYPNESAVSSVRSASPTSLYWDSPPRGSIAGAPNSTRGRRSAQHGGAGEVSSGGDRSDNGGGDDDDRGGFVDLFTIERMMSGRAAGPGGIPPLAQEMEEAVISDSGSTFDDGMVVDSTTGLRRRRGENERGRHDTGLPGEPSAVVVKPPPDGHGHTGDAGDSSHPILACRRRSRSIWLHFPHLELLFLFWAFEGAVAAQVSALKDAECAWVFWLALAALLLFPVLMVVMVWRTIAVRVRPNDLLVFRLHDSDGEDGSGNRLQDGGDNQEPSQPQAEDGGIPPTTESLPEWETGRAQRSPWQKFVSAWLENGMLFSWADTGSWESVATNDEEVKREADWFRIGFEPLFVDLSKMGCFYLIFLLVKWFGLACVGVLVEDSVKQLLYMFILHAVDLAVLVKASPFANRVINLMNAMLTAVDCVCTALMLGAAGFDEYETSTFHDIAFILQLFALIALVIPVYIDTGVALTILASEKLSQSCATREGDTTTHSLDAQRVKDNQDHEYVRRFARRSWPRYWCPMVQHNILAAANDIREGIRAPATRRHQTEKTRLGETTPGKADSRRGFLFRCCGMSLRCCGVSAAPTLPVPASVPNSCIGGDEWAKNDNGGSGGGCKAANGDGEAGKPQEHGATWTLPPKLRAAARGAGSWGGETALISSRSTVGRRPPSPAGAGGGPTHHRGRGSEASTVAGSIFTLGQSGASGTGSCGGVGFGAGGAASGRGLISSVFSSSPVPVDGPRRKVFDGMGGHSSASLEHGGVSSSSAGDFEGFAARGRSGDAASGRGLITSMFSTTPVAMDDAPRRHVYDAVQGVIRNEAGTLGSPEAGWEGGWQAGKSRDGLTVGGEIGRGLFSGNSPIPLAVPQKKWSGFGETHDEEQGLEKTGSEARSSGGGGGG